tara:strand:- start:5524 stop:5925 length:402 start_codon:yes stop_codon:yes gene_type:complete
MKLTKSKLKQLIKEELKAVLLKETQKDSSKPESRKLNKQGMRYYRRKKYQLALEKFKEAHEEDLKWTKPPYNAACQYALLGDVENAIIWLNKWVDNRPDQNFKAMYNYVQNDTDLDGIRGKKKFIKWLKTIKP